MYWKYFSISFSVLLCIRMFGGHSIVDGPWLLAQLLMLEMPTRLDLPGDQTQSILGAGQCHILPLLQGPAESFAPSRTSQHLPVWRWATCGSTGMPCYHSSQKLWRKGGPHRLRKHQGKGMAGIPVQDPRSSAVTVLAELSPFLPVFGLDARPGPGRNLTRGKVLHATPVGWEPALPHFFQLLHCSADSQPPASRTFSPVGTIFYHFQVSYNEQV
uniref:uncharacterized protein LINC02054 n=1 Tax=Macaca mulatta TaxID=9544 RepID=UPI0010A20EEF|nr:uncharacterized protein LINC02054 [Macaca mulatta]